MSVDEIGLRCDKSYHSMFTDGKKLRSGSSSTFPINITTSQDISSINENNSISAQSLQRFQQWKPGLAHKECCIND